MRMQRDYVKTQSSSTIFRLSLHTANQPASQPAMCPSPCAPTPAPRPLARDRTRPAPQQHPPPCLQTCSLLVAASSTLSSIQKNLAEETSDTKALPRAPAPPTPAPSLLPAAELNVRRAVGWLAAHRRAVLRQVWVCGGGGREGCGYIQEFARQAMAGQPGAFSLGT